MPAASPEKEAMVSFKHGAVKVWMPRMNLLFTKKNCSPRSGGHFQASPRNLLQSLWRCRLHAYQILVVVFTEQSCYTLTVISRRQAVNLLVIVGKVERISGVCQRHTLKLGDDMPELCCV
jgi:hypothetical protein